MDWLAARPEVDTSRIGYFGGSQGGAFGYFLLGLNRHFTRGAMCVPAMADHLAARQKRRPNWPQLLDAQPADGRAAAERNTPYFDIAHFAPRIRVPVRSLVGLSDTTCPPAGGWSAFNALASADKAMTTVPGMTHSTDPALEWNLVVWASGTRPAASSADACGLVGGPKPVAAVTSPDGRNEIRLWNDPLAYAVVRDGVEIVAKGEISLKVGDVDLRDLAKAKKPAVTRRAKTGAEPSPVYKKATLNLAAAFAKADFGDWGVELAARDDGVAYRFYTAKSGQVVVADEKADVRIPPRAKCWYGETWESGMEEAMPETSAFVSLAMPKGKVIYPPFVAQVGGTTLAVTESDVHDYPILNFTKDLDGAELEAKLAGFPKRTFNFNGKEDTGERRSRWVKVAEREDFLVKTVGARTFPWRVFLLADEPSKLCEADAVNALARPAAKGRDFSWVRPGKVAWEWWNDWDNMGWKGVSTANYKRFIDFAAKNGVEYVLMDEGWSERLDIWTFNPNVDVPEVIRYGKEKGVGIILWMAWAQVVGDEERVAAHFAKLGAVMVFNWHMDQPYCTNGFPAASYRFKSTGDDRNVVRQILGGTGGPCGTGAIDGKSVRTPFKNPREWFLASLKDVADFFNGLVDERGRKIPVILRYPHECDGDWFWWGRTWCTADEFRRLCRMEADYLREACGDDQILFAYTPDRTWKEFGKEGDSRVRVRRLRGGGRRSGNPPFLTRRDDRCLVRRHEPDGRGRPLASRRRAREGARGRRASRARRRRRPRARTCGHRKMWFAVTLFGRKT